MRFSLTLAALAFAAASTALAGCSADATDDSVVESASANQTSTCVTYAVAKARYDREVEAIQAQIQVDYAAALDLHTAEYNQARQELQDKIHALPPGPDGHVSTAAINALVDEFNAGLGPDGALARRYDERVAAAQARFDASVQVALQTYNSTICH